MAWLWRLTFGGGSARGPRAGWVLLVIAAAVYVPGAWSLPAIDRDESRFAQASRQMVRSEALGGWMVPRVQDRPRLNKPPLIYWLQAASAAALGPGEIGAYRAPSIIAAGIAILLTWRIGVATMGARAGVLGGLMLALCPVVVWEARQARADMVLLACTLLAMLGLARLWRGRAGPASAAMLWAGITLGILTKGPITPMVVGLTALTLAIAHGRWRWMAGARWGIGLAAVAGCVGLWVWQVAREVGWDAYLRIVSDEVLGRSVSAKEGHSGFPGYHLVLLAGLFWPGSMLVGLALARPILRRRLGRRPLMRRGEAFCFAWIVPSWLVFELVATKLPHYPLPLYPAIALLCARALVDAERGRLEAAGSRFVRIALWAWWLLGAFWLFGPGAAMVSMIPAPGIVEGALIVTLGAAGLAAVAMAALALHRRDWPRALRAMMGGAAAVSIIGIGFLLPRARTLWITDRLVAELARIDPAGGRPLAMAGYTEDSMVFATDGRVQRVDHGAAWLGATDGGLLVVPRDAVPKGARVLAHVEGFNYTKGRREALDIVERAGEGAGVPPEVPRP